MRSSDIKVVGLCVHRPLSANNQEDDYSLTNGIRICNIKVVGLYVHRPLSANNQEDDYSLTNGIRICNRNSQEQLCLFRNSS